MMVAAFSHGVCNGVRTSLEDTITGFAFHHGLEVHGQLFRNARTHAGFLKMETGTEATEVFPTRITAEIILGSFRCFLSDPRHGSPPRPIANFFTFKIV